MYSLESLAPYAANRDTAHRTDGKLNLGQIVGWLKSALIDEPDSPPPRAAVRGVDVLEAALLGVRLDREFGLELSDTEQAKYVVDSATHPMVGTTTAHVQPWSPNTLEGYLQLIHRELGKHLHDRQQFDVPEPRINLSIVWEEVKRLGLASTKTQGLTRTLRGDPKDQKAFGQAILDSTKKRKFAPELVHLVLARLKGTKSSWPRDSTLAALRLLGKEPVDPGLPRHMAESCIENCKREIDTLERPPETR